MIILEQQISIEQLTAISVGLFGDMVKAVADVERLLLENGSNQEDLWGLNLYPEMEGEDFIEFDSLINIRPRQNNTSRYVESAEVRERITEIVNSFIVR